MSFLLSIFQNSSIFYVVICVSDMYLLSVKEVSAVTLEGYLLCIEVAIAILLIFGRSMKH